MKEEVEIPRKEVYVMNYHTIKKDDMLNGEGLRVTLFVSGGENNCTGCHNPETHDPTSGLTIIGGAPLHPDNRRKVFEICKLVKEEFPSKNIRVYTCYDLEELDGEMVSDFNQYVECGLPEDISRV